MLKFRDGALVKFVSLPIPAPHWIKGHEGNVREEALGNGGKIHKLKTGVQGSPKDIA